MATSDIAIANRALTKLGVARIISFGDNNEQARALQSMYTIVRDSELRAYTWNFSIKRASLAALVDVPAFDWARQFQLPADCLRLLWAGNFYPGPNLSDFSNAPWKEYEIEGRSIMSNLPAPLRIRYVAQITDPTFFDPLFGEALACKLAIELAESLTSSSTNRQLAWSEYEKAIVKALRSDAIESPADTIADDTWMLSRNL
jgi:hypothetical protein